MATAPEPPNADLLPTHKTDISKITHLASLPPSTWTHLILYNTNTPTPENQPTQPPIDRASGLLTWVQDINWPISTPVTQLVLTLLNDSQETRQTHGTVLIDAMKRLFRESEDWEWICNLFGTVLSGVEDEAWIRDVFRDVVREFAGRVTVEAEREWEFGDRIREFFIVEGEGKEESVDATK